MNTYPALAQWDGTKLTPRTGLKERIASNGSVRMRATQSVVKMDPTVFHGFMTSTDRQTLIDFVANNLGVAFAFTGTEDGILRTCVFQPNAYQIEPLAGSSATFKATVYMREV